MIPKVSVVEDLVALTIWLRAKFGSTIGDHTSDNVLVPVRYPPGQLGDRGGSINSLSLLL